MVTDTDNEQAVDTLEDDEVHLLWTKVRTQLSGLLTLNNNMIPTAGT